MPNEAPVQVLLVDDDEVDVEAVQRWFRKQRLTNPVTVARNGEEALARLRGTGDYAALPRPYLILLDINMPRMNGIELLDALRADPALAHSTVYILTSSNNDADRQAAQARQVAGYLVKGTIDDGLAALVTALCGETPASVQ